MLRKLLIGALLSSAAMTGLAAAEPVVVTLEDGQIRGEQTGGVDSFHAIPYAAPPIGPLRWKPPQPVAPWQGVRDAKQAGVAN